METKASSRGKKIIMLVGPTGVGKTTTLAKLAARYAFQQEIKYRVGIITLDTYRIGAVGAVDAVCKNDETTDW